MSTTDKRRYQTVDRTFPYTGLGINGSSLQNKNSQSRSTCSNVSMDSSFQITAQTLMPMLLSIKQQNQHLSTQKQLTNQDLKSIDSLTKLLLAQNEALRLHYHQRSSDVRQLIQSLSINYNENLSEIKHISHTYREHNCILSKRIQEITEQVLACQGNLGKISGELGRSHLGVGKLEENLRERRVKNKIFEKTIKKLEAKRQESRLDQLQKQICDLHISINTLKKKNTLTLKLLKSQKNTISSQKPHITNQAIDAIKSVKVLQTQLEKIEDDYQKFCMVKDELVEREQGLTKKEQGIYGSLEGKKRVLGGLGLRRKQVEDGCKELQGNIQIANALKQSRQNEKKRLLETLQQKRNQLQTQSQTNSTQILQILQAHTTTVTKTKQNLTKITQTTHQILTTQLNPQLQHCEQTITNLKQDIEALEYQIEQMTGKIREMPNPVRDIMRIQMMLRRGNGGK